MDGGLGWNRGAGLVAMRLGCWPGLWLGCSQRLLGSGFLASELPDLAKPLAELLGRHSRVKARLLDVFRKLIALLDRQLGDQRGIPLLPALFRHLVRSLARSPFFAEQLLSLVDPRFGL
ncbi:MAG TPA: hypothetical protein VFL04_09180 [Rectinemataceae bacterium]|nr:hypothetical protein [Rectinemataceae bacterium]